MSPFTTRRGLLVILLSVASLLLCGRSDAQSLTSGGIEGTVTDPSGAVVANASVVLTSKQTASTQSATTNSSGSYRFTLLRPGQYVIAVTQSGFEKTERSVEVSVGQNLNFNLELQVGQSTQTVEVSSDVPLVDNEASQSTTFSSAQVALLPNAGGDITNIAFTAPGVVVNNTGGYGNFTVNGLPATSNMFTVNGENDMDPYFNINNSGASNLTLGANEISEATIVANPYGGQFGQLAGAQVVYTTKSGSNQFHGNAQYLWNGRYMNANDWFNNYYGSPRAFSNQNQWAASLGGPIFRDKTFFFLDTEGLRFVIPNNDSVTTPTSAFANAVLANSANTQPAEVPTYQRMLNLWANVPGAATAQPLAGSCADLTTVLPGFDPTTQACAQRFETSPTALASEWILAGRVDHRFSDNDNAFFRFKEDRGTQPTTISAINPAFDAISVQPSWDAQVSETHIFSPQATNSFTATLSYYQALFSQNHQAAVSAFPYDIITSGDVPYTAINSLRDFPQGRNITQYQFIDDYTLTRGRHNLRFGVNFRRYDVSDHNFYYNSPAVYFGYTTSGLDQFANGLAYQYRQSLNQSADVPNAMWGLGAYGMDEWNIARNLKLTLALRVERNSNPVCQSNCFANFKAPFTALASYTSADPSTVPYSSDIAYNQHQAYPGVDAIDLSPRFGFSWSPYGSNKTAISGGFGLFYDSPPAGLVDDLLGNPPVSVAIRVRPKRGVAPFDPNGGAALWAASSQAFNINETYGQIHSALAALGASFSPPAVTAINGKIQAPEWQEWNFQVQQAVTNSLVVVLNYTGNHGVKIPYQNQWANAFDQYSLFPGVSTIPTAAPVPNYGVVTEVQNGAVSNYNGLTVTVRKQFSHGVAAHFNYTWSHGIDEVSNGGIFTYGDSILGQNNPTSLYAGNYGSSDYDVRHNINADFVYTPAFHFGNKFVQAALGGWQWSFKVFWRTGLPFSVTDNNVVAGNYSGSIFGTPLPGQVPQTSSCGASAAVTGCLNPSAFVNAADASFTGYNYFPTGGRNGYRGPHFFDVDSSLFKQFDLGEHLKFGLGAQAFNVLNHPNFGLPDSGVGDTTFGVISAMASSPTSPYGNFLGFDSSPRVVQLSGKLVF